MAKKGLDTTFVHYGIRKEDINLIEALCVGHKLDFDWVKNPMAIALGMGKKFKKIKVRHLI